MHEVGESRTMMAVALFSICSLAFAGGNDERFERTNLKGNSIELAFLDGSEWTVVGHLSFGVRLQHQRLELDERLSAGNISIRIRHLGQTGCHIDSLSFGKKSPVHIRGLDLDQSLALKKIQRDDLDVVDARCKLLVFQFQNVIEAKSIGLTARIEPTRLSLNPLRFPKQNGFRRLSQPDSFYTYELNSRFGTLKIDGELADETLGQPLFDVFWRTISGHPDGRTLGWVFNDDANLYLALDVLPDNTMDGNADYGHLIVKSGDRMREFKVTANDPKWGHTGFTYTDRAAYQHKTYEFSIPLAEVELIRGEIAAPLELAVAVYGTVASMDLIDDFNGSQSALVAVPGSSAGTSVSTVPGDCISPFRDLFVEETGGMGDLEFGVNEAGSGKLVFDASDGAIGTANVVWDDDNDHTTMTPHISWQMGMFQWVNLVGVFNTGNGDVDLTIRFYSAANLADYVTGGPITVSGGGTKKRAPIQLMLSSLVPTGAGVNWDNIGAVELIVDNTAHQPGAVLAMEEVILSMEPVPVELMTLDVE